MRPAHKVRRSPDTIDIHEITIDEFNTPVRATDASYRTEVLWFRASTAAGVDLHGREAQDLP